MKYRILGSCVTRDAFAMDESLEIERYYARTSIASAFGSAQRFRTADPSTIESAFQRRIVQWDLEKDFLRTTVEGQFDRLVVDLIDERFDLVRNSDGAVATRSSEFLRACNREPTAERLASGSAEYWDLWLKGWRSFVQLVDAKVGRGAVIIHKAYWADRTESGAPVPTHTVDEVARANEMLDELYSHVLKDLSDARAISLPQEQILAADEHKWGVSPFHFAPAYYSQFLAELRDLVENDT